MPSADDPRAFPGIAICQASQPTDHYRLHPPLRRRTVREAAVAGVLTWRSGSPFGRREPEMGSSFSQRLADASGSLGLERRARDRANLGTIRPALLTEIGSVRYEFGLA